MSHQEPEIDWCLTTWEGSRREQLRRWRQLSVRERLQALEDMTDIAEYFAALRAAGKMSGAPTAGKTGNR